MRSTFVNVLAVVLLTLSNVGVSNPTQASDFCFKTETDVWHIFDVIASIGSFNIVVSPMVQNKIAVQLSGVTCEDAMHQVAKMCNLTVVSTELSKDSTKTYLIVPEGTQVSMKYRRDGIELSPQSFDFKMETELSKIVDVIGSLGRLSILMDPLIQLKMTVRLHKVTSVEALYLLAAVSGVSVEETRATSGAVTYHLRRAAVVTSSASPSPNGVQPMEITTASGSDAEEMVLIPAGEFLMGSATGAFDEKPVRQVYVDAFYMDKHEVTNRRFARFVKATGYRTEAERSGRRSGTWRHPMEESDTLKGKGDWPVAQVSWDDAMAFCSWAGKRLPTEAEWEKAARGGLEGKKYPWGDEEPRGRACYDRNSENARPDPVGKYAANGYGLFDMAGNVWEWCSDWYQANYYKGSPLKNPAGPSSGTARVVRGGSWLFVGDALRCAGRFHYSPEPGCCVGFRCVRSVR